MLPVNDPAQLTVKDVSGNEDGSVSLGGLGATLVDNDGSEQIVALQIKGVPDGFTLSAPAVNNGGGVWQVPVGTDFSKLTLIPPANFSGNVELTLSAFTQDLGLTMPLETKGSFTVTVKPVGMPSSPTFRTRRVAPRGTWSPSTWGWRPRTPRPPAAAPPTFTRTARSRCGSP